MNRTFLIFTLSALVALASGCRSSGSKGLAVTGPAAAHVRGDVQRQLNRLGLDESRVKGWTIATEHSPQAGTDGRWGAYSCDEHGCWHEIAMLQGPRRIVVRGPANAQRGAWSHGALHCVDFMTGAGIEGTEASPGHPQVFAHADGSRVAASELVGWRWPAKLLSLLPGGLTPQEAWRDAPWAAEDFKCATQPTGD